MGRTHKITIVLILLTTLLLWWMYSFFFLRVTKDIAYGDNPRQTMDLYVPKSSLRKNTLVVFVYGGAWRTGSKSYYGFMGKYFSNLGYPTIIPDYRLFPEVLFPAFIDDVAQAIKQMEKLDTVNYNNIILVGHSAGGHSASLLAIDPSYFEKHEIASPVHSFIGLSAPYDLPFNNELTPIFETALDEKEKTNTVALAKKYADNEEIPPILLLHGKDDVRVGLHHTENLTKAMKENDLPVTTYYLDDVSHTQIVVSFLPLMHYFSKPPIYIKDFLEKL